MTNQILEKQALAKQPQRLAGVERGVYFDAWFPGQHCYHPSLPPRRLRMVEQLQEFHATSLVWSALGGGSISLPYREQEAFGEIDPRFRFYGFVNDAEFIAECQKHGIKVFGIVFEVQGWEFPVELNEAEDRILSLNEPRGVGKPGWLGLREFSSNRYPNLWPPFESYFPGGLFNSDGERVTDLLEEACSRNIHGEPCHARWVECPDREHYCITMDRNNPVWREYLKAIIRIQIDAGVDGVQLDEAELPLTTLQYGGCFCKDCMKGFRAWLQGLPESERPAELTGEDLTKFHYGAWLLAQGFDFQKNRESSPLFRDYLRFQRATITRYFAELTDYAREYAAGKGRSVLVSGNFFNLLDQYYALEPNVDLIITEMRNTRYKQPAWYRYVAGFAGPKPVIVVENPYGGVVPEMVANLKRGKGYDRFRMSLYEGAALGANMSVPYGAWMGSTEQDSFTPPHDLTTEIQQFLFDHEHLFSRTTGSEVAVVYSVESNFPRAPRADELSNNLVNAASSDTPPFQEACNTLSDALQLYDVCFFPDGVLRADTLTGADLDQYRTLVLPECHFLTAGQVLLIEEFVAAGKQVIAIGEFATNVDPATRERLVSQPGLQPLADSANLLANLSGGVQVRVTGSDDLALHVQTVDAGAAVHIIRYAYDEEADRTPTLLELTLDLRLPGEFSGLAIHTPDGAMTGDLEQDGDRIRLHLRDVPLYSIVLLESGKAG